VTTNFDDTGGQGASLCGDKEAAFVHALELVARGAADPSEDGLTRLGALARIAEAMSTEALVALALRLKVQGGS
jgi:hypothetical protein